MWNKKEEQLFKKLNTFFKIQKYLDELDYNPLDDAYSPRKIIVSQKAHCLEGALLAGAILEYHGYKPYMIDLVAYRDDHHVITAFKTSTGWGSLSKSNTTLLRGRTPIYKTYRELVMSYFDFYFNTKGELSLESYSKPIPFSKFYAFDWKTSDNNLIELGYSLENYPHLMICTKKELKKLTPVSKIITQACFLGSDVSGLYKISKK